MGGHSFTIPTPEMENIDIGFMVMNSHTYPNLIEMFDDLDVPLLDTDMSFAVFDDQATPRFSWSFQSSLPWLARNIWKRRLWKFVKSHREFSCRALAFLRHPSPSNLSMRDFVVGLDPLFVSAWLVPFISAVWSEAGDVSLDFAAWSLLRFLYNHQFLTLAVLKWTTPAFRSEDYISKLIARCGRLLTVRTNARVVAINPNQRGHTQQGDEAAPGGTIVLEGGESLPYDRAICTVPAPAACSLHTVGTHVHAWLSEFATSESAMFVHTSPYGMPSAKADWSSWNVQIQRNQARPGLGGEGRGRGGAKVTYWLSKLQHLQNQNIFLTLNPTDTPPGTFFETSLQHPVMNVRCFEAQQKSSCHQGVGDIFYAGAWLRNGFHEDGLVTGLIAARLAMDREDIPVLFPAGSGQEPIALKGRSRHIRHHPFDQRYDIEYPLFVYAFDTLSPPSWGFNRDDFLRAIPASTNPSSNGSRKEKAMESLDTSVRHVICAALQFWPLGRIEVIGNLRYFGVYFNPITPYFVYSENGDLTALLLEVHNTPWGEKCTYVMRVCQPGNKLVPSKHEKVMHVSPFNEPPSLDSSARSSPSKKFFYTFSLRNSEIHENGALKGVGGRELHILLTSEETIDKAMTRTTVMSASWVIDPTPSASPIPLLSQQQTQQQSPQHTIKTGSLRALFAIYYQAALLFWGGLKMHPYQTTQTGPKPFVSPVMLSSQLGFALVAFEYSRISETLFSPPAMAFTALALSLSLHHRHQGSNLVLWLANFILLAICTAINAQSLLVTGDVLPLVSFFSTVFSFLLSLIVAMPTQFAEFRTICHLNASLGSLSLLWSLPLGLHVGCAFFTFQIMLRNRFATGLLGKVSLICFTSVVMVCLLPRLWSPPAPIQLLFADAEASAAGAASGDLKLTGISVELVDEVTVVLAQQRAFAGGLLLSTLLYFVYADALRSSIAWVQLLPIVLWLCLSIGTLVAAGWPSLAYNASSTTLSWSSLLFVMLLALGLRLYFSIDCPSSIHMNGGFWDSVLLAGANMLMAWLLPGRLQLVSFEEEKGKEWKRNMSASAEVRNALDLESNGVTLLFVVRPWPFLSALLVDGELGLGESFVAGHWREGPRGQGSLVAVLHALLPCMVDWRVQALRYCFPSFWLRQTLFAASFGRFDRKQAENSIAQHYDVSNDLFEAFLGPDMVYTCAKFTANKNSSSEGVRSLTSEVRARGDVALAKAQVWKTERILELCNSPRTLLDIGCGKNL